MKKKQNVRLTKDVFPVHYEITLEPDLLAHVFSGEEVITLTLLKSTKEITLHAKELDITEVDIVLGTEKIQAKKISYNTKAETATFVFAKILPKGEVKIHLTFTGILASDMRGFYKSKYTVNGEDRFMATTQFEATDARRCIPCFDEPAQKAIFTVHLIIPTDKTAISNTLPVTTKSHRDGYNIVSFAPTPKMSTYLVAFMAGDFEWLEQKTKSGVLVRIVTVPGKVEQGRFALDVTVRCLEFYEKYFDIPYPLNTLDMLAIPDFASGAMENWGAITFREIYLLIDEAQSSTSAREHVAGVIIHELAHQWFGNLVTMEWWTDLWLNEGFASYVPYLAMDALFPHWRIWEKFTTDDLASSLRLDALKNTHPVEVDIHHPDEIREVFDAISYNKGATVIGMLAQYLGQTYFRDGLRLYLKKHSYKNTNTIDLWDAFEKVSKKPVKKMMEVWTKKSGYPVVSVSLNPKKHTIELSQKRYYSNKKSGKNSHDTTVWPIPLSFVTPKNIQSIGLMTKKKLSLPMKPDTWIKLNPSEVSMYRTKYDSTLSEKLKKGIKSVQLNPQDRLGIVRDLFSLAEAGESEIVGALEMLISYTHEKEYIVWVEIVSGLITLNNLLYGSKSYNILQKYAQEILSEIIKHVGWESEKNESHNDTLLRTLVLSAGATFGTTSVIQEAQKRFENRFQKPIPADFRGMIYASVVRTGSDREYQEIKTLYQKETLHEEKNRLLAALSASRDPRLLEETLNFIMTDSVRLQDKVSAYGAVLINPFGRVLGWKFIKKNWKTLVKEYGDGNHMLASVVSVLNRNTTRSAYNDIKDFFKRNPVAGAERTLLQTLERIDSNISWLARDEKKISQWLLKQ